MANIKGLCIILLLTGLLTACTSVSPTQTQSIPTPVPSIAPTVSLLPQIGSGVAHTCLLTQEGKVICWGQGAITGQQISPDQFGKPIPVEGLNAISVAAGWYHTCAATPSGQVRCWGRNSNGQLGDGTRKDSPSLVDIPNLAGVTSVSAGAQHSCALTKSGKVYCWGQNTLGQLGDGSLMDRFNPVPVASLPGPAASIDASPTYTCAILRNGQVECWGQLTFLPEGQNQEVHTSPQTFPNLSGNIKKLAAGDNHLCVLTTDQEVKCEGISFPTETTLFSRPVAVLGQLQGHILDILAETDFTCVLSDQGKVYCWGDNYFNQIGDDTFQSAGAPKEVTQAGTNVVALGGGHYTVCALKADGGVKCWGDTSFGQLGDGTVRWK